MEIWQKIRIMSLPLKIIVAQILATQNSSLNGSIKKLKQNVLCHCFLYSGVSHSALHWKGLFNPCLLGVFYKGEKQYMQVWFKWPLALLPQILQVHTDLIGTSEWWYNFCTCLSCPPKFFLAKVSLISFFLLSCSFSICCFLSCFGICPLRLSLSFSGCSCSVFISNITVSSWSIFSELVRFRLLQKK